MARQAKFMTILSFDLRVTLTFNLAEQMFQMTLLLLEDNILPNYFEIHAQMN